MSKKIILLIIIIVSGFLPLNFFNATRSTQPIYINDEKDNTISAILAPKSSGYTITEKWNYTASDINDVKISLDGNYVAICQNTWNNLTLFHKDSNNTLWNTDIIPNSINSFDISADGKYISAGNTDGSVYLFNNTEATPSWSKTYEWEHLTGAADLVHVAISGDGKYTAAASENGLHLLDNNLKSSKWTYSTGSPFIRAVDIGYNPIEGRYYIAIGDAMGNVTLFDETSPVPLWSNDTTSGIDELKISDDGSHILAKNSDDEVYLFDNTVQNPKLALWNYTSTFHVGIDISADGKNIIIVGVDRIHYINNTASTNKVKVWEVAPSYFIDEGGISGDGKYILLGGSFLGTFSEGKVELYNSTKITPKDEDWLETKGAYIPDVAINGFGNYFAIIVDDNIIHFYHHDVPLPSVIAARSGGGGSDDEAPAIPFGNYYLAFTFIAIISLIVIAKKKEIFKLK